ncbi:MAG TPA: heme-binding domain-containing protein [Pyrinomonadaceae bacterium]|nr:heme-binding domain-containing protein [Pyrinomonadaceae bacterium]
MAKTVGRNIKIYYDNKMKKALKIAALALAIIFVAIQFFQIDKTEEQTDAKEMLEASVRVGPDVSMILSKSCNDCHSNKTVYPWYANVQPFGWFLKSHIDDGKRHLNFSVWNTYADKKKSKKLEEICEQVESKEMPLPSYLWIHRDAVLSDSDRKTLCGWANEQKGKIDARMENAPIVN